MCRGCLPNLSCFKKKNKALLMILSQAVSRFLLRFRLPSSSLITMLGMFRLQFLYFFFFQYFQKQYVFRMSLLYSFFLNCVHINKMAPNFLVSIENMDRAALLEEDRHTLFTSRPGSVCLLFYFSPLLGNISGLSIKMLLF